MQFVQDEVFRLISNCISLTRHHNWLKKRSEGAFISSVYEVLIPSLPWLSYFKCYGNTSKAFLDKELLSKLWKHHLINFYNWLLTTFLDSSLKRKQELPLFWDLQKKKKKTHQWLPTFKCRSLQQWWKSLSAGHPSNYRILYTHFFQWPHRKKILA